MSASRSRGGDDTSPLLHAAPDHRTYSRSSSPSLRYAKMRAHLNWTQPQFLEYIKLKALDSQPDANVVVGLPAFTS